MWHRMRWLLNDELIGRDIVFESLAGTSFILVDCNSVWSWSDSVSSVKLAIWQWKELRLEDTAALPIAATFCGVQM